MPSMPPAGSARASHSSRKTLCAFVVALLACLLPSGAEGHMSIVCSSTSPTNPGAFTFWVGTYHENPMSGAVPGEIYVREPDGRLPHTTFSAWCSLQDCPAPPCPTDDPGIAGTATISEFRAEMVKSGHCKAVTNAGGDPLFYDDSVLSCYQANVGMDPQRYGTAVTAGTGTFPAGKDQRETINCNGIRNTQSPGPPLFDYNAEVHLRDIRTMYGVFVTGVKAGTYKTWTVGTDDNLAASPKAASRTPCSMSEAAPYYFDISVADGLTDCIVPPPVQPNANPGSLTFCAPAQGRRIFSGFVCSVTCAAGFLRLGTLVCENGKWSPYKCSDQPVCKQPGEVANDVNIPGKYQTKKIVGVWDGEPGRPIDPGCGVLTESGTACNYTCDTDTSPFCTPTRTTPTGAEKLAFPLRGEILCGSDGNWYPGNNFCGCRDQPCFTPTETLSLTPTFSLSPTLTKSLTMTRTLTMTPTLTPTISTTPLPLCVVLEPFRSVFCNETDVFPWIPWLLMLLLCCSLCCLLFACTRKRNLPPDEPIDEPDGPAIVEDDEIHVGVKPVEVPPPPPIDTVDVTVSKVMEPAEPEIEVGVHPVPEPPESDVHIGVHKIPQQESSILVGVSRRGGADPLGTSMASGDVVPLLGSSTGKVSFRSRHG
eukprot:TRINITY_DN52636_c0_g1_i1.p1 TRINITY_DN52636_c0_g1~~TRINITY_DN52636_c0_g1_i1.p1  ORF type:complete len:650 (+),score=170.92 TRINITY_DN52636_c0_g1_i1:142-2091(+)